jgi:hypothetical protein
MSDTAPVRVALGGFILVWETVSGRADIALVVVGAILVGIEGVGDAVRVALDRRHPSGH